MGVQSNQAIDAKSWIPIYRGGDHGTTSTFRVARSLAHLHITAEQGEQPAHIARILA
jgi:hypothetical protein